MRLAGVLDQVERILTIELKECSDADVKSRKTKLSDHQKEIQILSAYLK